MIRIENVWIDLPDFRLQEITLRIQEGEFFILLGPTGAGKTVILEAIAGLVPVTKGRIRLGGRDVTDLPPERRGIGIVYQDYALFPHLSVSENITYGLRYHRHDPESSRKWVAWLMRELEIQHLAQRSPVHLSGGEKQRVALARALAVHPSVLLLDEPLSALDPNFREGIRDLLKKLHQEVGITFLMVTHDFSEALFLGQRTAILNEGTLEQVGSVFEVFQQPRTPFVADFVGMKNVFPARFDGGEAVLDGLTLRLASAVNGEHQYVGIRAEDILINPQAQRGGEEWNLLTGEILSISHRGLYHEIALKTGKVVFKAMLTRSAIFEMDLPHRQSLSFAIKPADIHAF